MDKNPACWADTHTLYWELAKTTLKQSFKMGIYKLYSEEQLLMAREDSGPSHLSIQSTCCLFITPARSPPSWQRSSKTSPQHNHTKSFGKETSTDPSSSLYLSTGAKNYCAVTICYLTGIKVEWCKTENSRQQWQESK